MHLSVIQALLLIAYMFHQTESWDYHFWAVYSIISVALFLYLKRFRSLIFIAAAIPILHKYFLMFPNLANHSNLSFFLFLLITPYSIYSLFHKKQQTGESLLKTLRLFALITYFFAAFHKLNIDFFHPEVSCANDKMGAYLDLLPGFLSPLKIYLTRLLPLIGFFSEAIIPIFLIVPQWRWFGVLFQCGLHFLLAPLGFIDFSSLALVLSWSFVQPQVPEGAIEKQLQNIGWSCLVLVMGLGIFRWESQAEEYKFFEGVAFGVIFIPFVWRSILTRIDLSQLHFPRPLILKMAVVLFFIYGFSNYLGLRTAGTFSMFSNIQTEGEKSNHLLLSSNPFKIFPYQDDLVEVVSVAPHLKGFYRKMPVAGQLIPRIEFSRMLDIMRQQHLSGSMEIIYQGTFRKSENAAFDQEFYLSAPDWQKKLFKFRAVLKEGPQICAW